MKNPGMKITGIKKVTQEKWLNLFVADYQNKDYKGHWVYASRRDQHTGGHITADAVLIVATVREEHRPPRLVLVREYRIPIGAYVYGLPAGLLEPGESVETTACRELLEETGLEVIRVNRISPPLLSSSGLTDEAACMVFVDARPSVEGRPALEGSEDIEIVLLEFDDVHKLCHHPDLPIDGRAWMVLHEIEQLGKIR